MVFDDWFSTIATNVDDMPDFHADEWSNIFGTSTYDLETSKESEEVVKQPTMETEHEIENDEMDEEDLVRRIREHNPLIQPTRSKPERTYSQATVESIRNPITQNSSRQQLPQKRQSPSQSFKSPTEPATPEYYHAPPSFEPHSIQPVRKLTPQRPTVGPTTSVRKKLK